MIVLAFLAIAAIGSFIRWKTSIFFGIYKGTLIVNIIGSFCLGLSIELNDPELTLVCIGGLGSLTTFSTFCANIDFLSEKNYRSSFIYSLLTVTLGVLAATVALNI